MNYKVLFNPLSGKEAAGDSVEKELTELLKEDTLEFIDLTKISYAEFFATCKDAVIITGGDGTLNRFVNQTDGIEISVPVYYYASGNGNDFWTDIGKKHGDKPVELAPYIKDLPTVTVNGQTYKFINGVGYGIDGYCCEVGDRLNAAGKKVNYTSIAIKGCLASFKPANAEVTVDGVTKKYKKVWIAPTMNGRMYGGGMLPTPAQDRLNGERTLSICVLHNSLRLPTLIVFPKLFTGEHANNKKRVDIMSGKEITVKFDKPCALQIDGETVLGVTEYTAKSAKI